MPTSWFRPHPLPDLDHAHSFDIAGEWNSAFGQVPCLWAPGDRVSGAVLPCLEGGVLHGWGQDWVPSPDGQFCHREGPMDGWLLTGEEEGVGVWSRVMWLSRDQWSILLLQCMENEKQNKILQSQRYDFQVLVPKLSHTFTENEAKNAHSSNTVWAWSRLLSPVSITITPTQHLWVWLHILYSAMILWCPLFSPQSWRASGTEFQVH